MKRVSVRLPNCTFAPVLLAAMAERKARNSTRCSKPHLLRRAQLSAPGSFALRTIGMYVTVIQTASSVSTLRTRTRSR